MTAREAIEQCLDGLIASWLRQTERAMVRDDVDPDEMQAFLEQQRDELERWQFGVCERIMADLDPTVH